MVLIFYTRHKLLFVCTYKSNIEKLFVSFVIKITGFLDKQMIATTESIYNNKSLDAVSFNLTRVSIRFHDNNQVPMQSGENITGFYMISIDDMIIIIATHYT